jgi:hypothetical protein
MTMPKHDDLFELATVAPMDAAKECRQKIAHLEFGYQAKLRRCVAEAYAVAYAMQYDHKAWLALIKDEFWKKRKKRPRADHKNKIMLHVMVYVFDATSKNAYDRAWKYATALEEFFNNGVKPKKIEKKIEANGGLEALLRTALQARKLARKNARFADDAYFDVKPSKAGQAIDQTDGPDGEAVKQERLPRRKKKKLVRFSASPSLRGQLLGLSEGEKARVTIRRVLGRSKSAGSIIKVTPLANRTGDLARKDISRG